ncbi:MAG: hypothetical protein ACK55I_33340, partial [bacterium]
DASFVLDGAIGDEPHHGLVAILPDDVIGLAIVELAEGEVLVPRRERCDLTLTDHREPITKPRANLWSCRNRPIDEERIATSITIDVWCSEVGPTVGNGPDGLGCALAPGVAAVGLE